MTKRNAKNTTSSNVGGEAIEKTITKSRKDAGASKDAGSSKQKNAKTKVFDKQMYRNSEGEGFFYLWTNQKNYSIEGIRNKPNSTVTWNKIPDAAGYDFMQQLKLGDCALFYRSNDKPSRVGLIATVKVVKITSSGNTGKNAASADRGISISRSIVKTVDIKLDKEFQKCITRQELENCCLENREIITRYRYSMGPAHPEDVKRIMKKNEKNVEEDKKKTNNDVQKDDKGEVDKDEIEEEANVSDEKGNDI